jgi:hypothetical protein
MFSTLENTDVTLSEAMAFNRQFLLRNGQSIRFFSVTDTTLTDLSSLDHSRFSFLDGSVDATDVTPFVGPGVMRVGGCGHAATPC